MLQRNSEMNNFNGIESVKSLWNGIKKEFQKPQKHNKVAKSIISEWTLL